MALYILFSYESSVLIKITYWDVPVLEIPKGFVCLAYSGDVVRFKNHKLDINVFISSGLGVG